MALSERYHQQVSFIECGPGKGLSYFVNKYKGANDYKALRTVPLLPSAREARESKATVIGKLWMSGLIREPNAPGLFRQAKLLTGLPVYQFNYQKCWLEKSSESRKALPVSNDSGLLSGQRVPPRNEIRRMLVNIWEELLGVEPDRNPG